MKSFQKSLKKQQKETKKEYIQRIKGEMEEGELLKIKA